MGTNGEETVSNPLQPAASLTAIYYCCRGLQVVKLRETLEAEAGIPDLEADLVDPAVPGFAKRAAEIFHRDGFCLVKVSSHARGSSHANAPDAENALYG